MGVLTGEVAGQAALERQPGRKWQVRPVADRTFCSGDGRVGRAQHPPEYISRMPHESAPRHDGGDEAISVVTGIYGKSFGLDPLPDNDTS